MRALKAYFGLTVLGAALLLALAACSTTPAPFDPLPSGRSVIAPTGFVQFCQRRPDQCEVVSPVAERSPPAPADRPWTSSIAFPRAETIDADPFVRQPQPAWPQARFTLLNYRPYAMLAHRDTGVDISLWRAMETPAPSPPRRAYPVISRDASGARLRLSSDLEAELAGVDVAINRAITPRTDLDAFGVDNYWTLPLTDGPRAEGNCKHYALEKRRRLVADGVPADALSLAIVVTRSQEIHAVLVISTDQGDIVLDNLTDAIRPWRQTGYRWMVRQTPASPMHWVEAG